MYFGPRRCGIGNRTHYCTLRHAPSPALGEVEDDVLRAFPEAHGPDSGQVLIPLDDRQEMVSSELAHLRREAAGAVGEQNLRLTGAPGVEKHLSRSGIARCILEPDAEVKVS